MRKTRLLLYICASTWIEKGSVAILVVERLAGVTPDVNLRNPSHAVNEACKRGATLALKPREDVNKSPKTRVSVTSPKRTDVLHVLKKKKETKIWTNILNLTYPYPT